MTGSIDGVVLGIDCDTATANHQLALTLYTFTLCAGHTERATFDIDITAVLILVVCGSTCRGGAIEFTLDTLVAHATDGHCTALHEEILITTDTVLHRLGNIQRQVLDTNIVAALDGVLGITLHIQGTIALQLNLTFTIDTSFLRTVGTVGQGILGVLLCADLDTLAVINVDGSPTGIGHGKSCQCKGTLIGTTE